MKSIAVWLTAGFLAFNSLACRAAGLTENADFNKEAVDLLSHYLQLDTTNPPGNEKIGARFLADILEKNGISAKLFEPAPGRDIVYARLKGNGKKRAIILLSHIDVVPAKASDWMNPPFAGTIAQGEIWGRGAIDMKSMGIAELETMLALKRSGMALDRDVIFLATPDEEVGGRLGAGWFAKNHADLVKDAEFLLNEVGFITVSASGKPIFWGVDICEKSVLWLKVTAHGQAGHASMPIADSAPDRLVRALAKIVNSPPAPKVLPVVQEWFHDIAPRLPEAERSEFLNIKSAIQDPKVYQSVLQDRALSAVLRNTVSLTVLKAGYKTNVIPSEASAQLDCRLLPGENKDQFIKEMKNKIDDPNIEVSEVDWLKTEASPLHTDLYEAIAQVAAENQPGVPVVPIICAGFTDSHWFRDLGITAYGFAPFEVDPEHLATIHGTNERLGIKSFTQGTSYLLEIINMLCTQNPSQPTK